MLQRAIISPLVTILKILLKIILNIESEKRNESEFNDRI